jgi:hypothetical protein
MVLIAWNSFRSLSTSRIILLWPTLWIKSIFIGANILCHRNGLALTCVCIPKYFKDKFFRVHLGLVQPQLVFSHLQAMYYVYELVVFFDNHSASCSYMKWSSTCINTPPMQNIRPRIHLKMFVKFHELEHGRRRHLALKLPNGLVTKLIPL